MSTKEIAALTLLGFVEGEHEEHGGWRLVSDDVMGAADFGALYWIVLADRDGKLFAYEYEFSSKAGCSLQDDVGSDVELFEVESFQETITTYRRKNS